MTPEFLTPEQRNVIQLRYQLQANDLYTVAEGYMVGTWCIGLARKHPDLVLNEHFSDGVNVALESLEQFRCDLLACASNLDPDVFTTYNPNIVIGQMLPEHSKSRGRVITNLFKLCGDTEVTLATLQMGILSPEVYLEQGEYFLATLQRRYIAASQRAAQNAFLARFSTHPNFVE